MWCWCYGPRGVETDRGFGQLGQHANIVQTDMVISTCVTEIMVDMLKVC